MSHVWGDNHADPAHARAIVERARTAGTQLARPAIIGIDGPAGSGKSSLAQLVSAELADAPIVHVDELIAGWDGLAGAAALLTVQVLVPLHRGEPAAFRRFDWHTNRYADLVAVPGADVVIVEGCASTTGVAAQYLDVRVWLDAPHDGRMRRGLARDGDGFAGHWQQWAAQESAVFAADDTRARADLTFQT